MQKNERKEQILLDLVQEYIETAEPVSSGELLRKHKYECSSATVRNIMVELDETGFLAQPHTSAGRVPTPKAYRFFVDKVALGSREAPQGSHTQEAFRKILPDNTQRELRRAMRESPYEAAHMLSRTLAELTGTMAFAGIAGLNQFYREGLLRLLDEPEFMNVENVRQLVEYADSLEERLEQLYEAIQDDIRVYIGAEEDYRTVSPFSLMAFSTELPGYGRGAVGLIGPMRMRYVDNLALLNEVRELFEEN